MATWKDTVRKLLGHIKNVTNPFEEVDSIVHSLASDSQSLQEVIRHIETALDGSEPISFLAQQPHSEEMVRDFLQDVLKGLKKAAMLVRPEDVIHLPVKKSLLIAVDFDGTIVEHRFPEIGALLPQAVEVLRSLIVKGHRLVLFTCREDNLDGSGRAYLTEAVKFCEEHGVKFVSVNHTLSSDDFRLQGGRKVHADLYIDDRNLGGFQGWEAVRKALLESASETKKRVS